MVGGWLVLVVVGCLVVVRLAGAVSVPVVSGVSFSQVSSGSAVVSGVVAPEGGATSYVIEFGSTAAYGQVTAAGSVEGLSGSAPVEDELTGLSPGTVYHFRVAARNSAGVTDGGDETFTTFPESTGLPDGRALEMVSPPNNHDADVYSPTVPGLQQNSIFGTGAEVPFQVSLDGSRVTYAGDPTPEGNGAAVGGFFANQFLASRASGRWVQQTIAPPGRAYIDYTAFSADLSVGVLRQFGEPFALSPQERSPLVPGAEGNGFKVLYERDNGTGGERALFGKILSVATPFSLKTRFVGGSEDFGVLVFEASGELVAGGPVEGNGIYRSSGGGLEVVNVLPHGGGVEPAAVAGRPNLTGSGDTPDFSGAVSGDGGTVFWTGVESHGLYMSRAGQETVQVDVSHAGGVGGGGVFQTATSDGRLVYFTDDAAAGLTADTVPGSGANLYVYDTSDGVLSDLTAASDARVQATVGVSSDGSYVYFVAGGALAEGAPAGDCETECGLFVWHEGATRFIATLSTEDGRHTYSGFRETGDWAPSLGHRTAQVSGDGLSLVFMSGRRLTGYDNEGLFEVYLFDYGSGGISCVSCDPSGEALQPSSLSSEELTAGLLPISWDESRARSFMVGDGERVFFDSLVPLVPEDTNGLVDVYEWERDGVGSCGVSGGCVFSLSGGKSKSNSYLVGSSVSGDDVFFVTTARLVEADQNGAFDLYDARVGGGGGGTSLACSGTGCQGLPGAQPVFSTPASATFAGVGNFPAPGKTVVVKPLTRAQRLSKALKVCRAKRDRKARAKCKSSARKRYGPAVKPKSRAKGRVRSSLRSTAGVSSRFSGGSKSTMVGR